VICYFGQEHDVQVSFDVVELDCMSIWYVEFPDVLYDGYVSVLVWQGHVGFVLNNLPIDVAQET